LADNHFGEALIDALWGISWTSESYIQEVIDLGCVPYLVHHLKNNQLSVLIPALRALGNIVTGNDLQTNAVLSCQDFLPRVFELISNPKKTVRKEACWLISNIAAGNQHQIALIINYPHYIEALKKAINQDVPEVVTEAAWALGNLASGATGQQISKMVNEYAYLASVGIMLNTPSPKVKQIGLEAALNVLNSWGGEPEDNIYIKLFKKEGLVEKVKDSMIDATQSLMNIAQDILAHFKDQPEGSEFEEKTHNEPEVNVNINQNQVFEPRKQSYNDDEDDVDDYEDEEDEERREAELERYRITRDISAEEDNEKYKLLERED